jgi:hypothetical protein
MNHVKGSGNQNSQLEEPGVISKIRIVDFLVLVHALKLGPKLIPVYLI